MTTTTVDTPSSQGYRAAIRAILVQHEIGDLNPIFVEAFMSANPRRLEPGYTLDRAVREAAIRVLESTTEECERLAKTLGLVGQ